jgi:murein DD-endopeptidase MepM/ murein hydrolase activator NlpD
LTQDDDLKKSIIYDSSVIRTVLAYKSIVFFLIIPTLIIFFFIIKVFEKIETEKNEVNIYSENILSIQKFFLGQFSDIDSKIEPIIKKGDSIQKILSDYRVNPSDINAVSNLLRRDYNQPLRPDQKLSVILSREKNGISISRLTLAVDNITSIHIYLNKDKVFESKIVAKILTKKNHYVETTIDRSLFGSTKDSGIENSIVIRFARLYGFEFDFQRDLKKNDKIKILYERYLDDDGIAQKTGNIIFSQIIGQEKNISLYRYEAPDGKTGYYTTDGKSIEKTLMRTPINGAKLSSRFGFRIHPILGFNAMHQGTDFAAPVGTPIMASGNGIVEYAGWKGGYGKFITIRHNSEYKTNYAHLSDYAKGMRKGTKVQQGQIIGYVGSTGSSTGPHLHYEIEVNGKKVNSQTLKLPDALPLEGNNKLIFETQKRNIEVLIADISKKK